MTTTPAIPDVTSTAPDTAGRRFQELGGIDFAVADLSLAEFGRKEIRLAEH